MSAFRYFVVWLFAALAAVYVKSNILSYMNVGRALGRIEIPEMTRYDPSRSYLFTFFERLSFFRSGLLLGFVVLPLIGLAILYWIPRRWRMFCAVAVTFAATAFLYLQMHGYWMVGQFQSWELWYDSIRWGWKHPDDAQRYAGATVLLKLWICLTVPGCVGILFTRKWKQSNRRSQLIRVSAWTCYCAVLFATITSWCSRIHSTPYHRSALSICLRVFCGFTESDVSKYDSLRPEEVVARWREVTNSPEPKHPPDYFGLAKECDVVCFVLETAPTRCLDLNGNLDDLPNLKRLRERAWIAPNHVTTYPYTSSALFSILTSWYPTDVQYLHVSSKGRAAPGLMRSLGMSGYATAAYLPVAIDSEDENLHRVVGISKFVYAEAPQASTARPEHGKSWHEKVNRDKAALELLKKDMSEWIRDNRRYAVLYLPQIGHAPWPDVSEDGTKEDTVSRGHAVLVLQDKWLGEILRLLEAVGRLDHTVVLVTGDHGIRTKMEDPEFVGGSIDPYSFQVPCVLFAPQALHSTVVILWITSHIDLSPSILDLVGVIEGRDFELGSPLWDERLRARTTFFWANKYLGADGFHEKGKL